MYNRLNAETLEMPGGIGGVGEYLAGVAIVVFGVGGGMLALWVMMGLQ